MRSDDDKDDLVDETIDESFPASDPPSSWAGGDRDVTPDPERVEDGFADDEYDHESDEPEEDDMLLPPTPEPPSRR